nr:uncharacterized protein LOC118076147 [Zootoca vivipara]
MAIPAQAICGLAGHLASVSPVAAARFGENSDTPPHTQEFGLPASESLSPLISSRIRCLRRLFRRCRRVAPSKAQSSPWRQFLRYHIPSPGLLEDEQFYILGVIQSCQAAELRGLRTLKCSKQETAKAILDILGPLEHFRDRPLTLALALEALLQLSTMRPKFSCDMISAILHRTMEAVLQGPEKEEEREELKRHFRLLLGSLLMEAPQSWHPPATFKRKCPDGIRGGFRVAPPIPYPFLGHRASLALNLVQDQSWQTLMVQKCQGLCGGGSKGRFGPDSEMLFPPAGPAGYALGESGEAQKLAASSISLLLAVARKFPRLRMTVVRPDLACFRQKSEEDDIIIEDL